MKAYSYIRFSSGAQSGNTSVERQLESAKTFCLDSGYKLQDTTFEDLAVSSKDGKNWMDAEEASKRRDDGKHVSALADFYMGVCSGELDTPCALIIDSADRFSRGGGLKATANVAMLVSAGVTLCNVTTGLQIQPLDDEASEAEHQKQEMALMMFLMDFNRAHSENRERKRKVEAGYAILRESNVGSKIKRASSSALPWWMTKKDILSEPIKGTKLYRKQVVLIPEKVEIVHFIYKQAIKYSLVDIAIQVKKKYGVNHGADAIHRVLRHHAVYGRLEPFKKTGRKQRTPIDDHYPAILTKEEYDEVQLALKKRATSQTGRRTKDPIRSYWHNLLKYFDGSSTHHQSVKRPLANGGINRHYYIHCRVDKKLKFSFPKAKVDELVLDLAESLNVRDFVPNDSLVERREWEHQQFELVKKLKSNKQKTVEVEDAMLTEETQATIRLLDKLLANELRLIKAIEDHAENVPEQEEASPTQIFQRLHEVEADDAKCRIARQLFEKLYIGKVKNFAEAKMIPFSVKESIVRNHSEEDVVLVGKLNGGPYCLRVLGSLIFVKWSE